MIMRRQVSRQLGSTLSPLGTQTAMAVGCLITAEMLLLATFSLLQPPLGLVVENRLSGAGSHNQYGTMLTTDNRFFWTMSFALSRHLLLMSKTLHPPPSFLFVLLLTHRWIDMWVGTHLHVQVHGGIRLFIPIVNTLTLSKSLWLLQFNSLDLSLKFIHPV